jgi:hypothetical protein
MSDDEKMSIADIMLNIDSMAQILHMCTSLTEILVT